MTRPAADVINAIIANLEMAEVASRRHLPSATESDRMYREGCARAYSEAIALIRTEAADLLKEVKL